MPKKILVIGAGLGGLAAAIRLARAGHSVEVWEKNEEPGGKLKEISQDGFRWDTGPSLLTMPHILRELFADCGERLEDHLDLFCLESACRYFWTDGTTINEDASFWKQPEVARFLEYARGIYELSGEAYLHHPPSEFWRALTPANLPKLRHLPKVATFRTMAQEVERRISDPHLRQIFLRFATYNGSSPYLTPATFNIIPYVEAEFGAWYVRGGMARIGTELLALAQRCGVTFHFNTTANLYNGNEAFAEDGRKASFDYLVCNGDVIGAARQIRGLLPESHAAKLEQPPLSTSGFILFLGVRGSDPRLGHHNIFFSDDYPQEFTEIHQEKANPGEPTIYISISSRTDSAHAPADHDNWFVLVNAPARDPKQSWTHDETQSYRDLVIRRLQRFGFDELPQRIVSERTFTPSDFASRDLAYHGSLYGWASHSIRTSLFRPPLRGPGNVFFTGGTTHPGGGIPLVLLSGKMVADLIQGEEGMRSLQPNQPPRQSQGWSGLEIFALAAFVFWSIAGLIFTFGHITPTVVAQWPVLPALKSFVGLCMDYGDPALIILAFINTHLHAARQWSALIARQWGVLILISAYAIEEFGSRTGFPFGDYHYTNNFGPMAFDVPLTIPLAWHVVVTNALFIVRSIVPHLSRLMEAGLVGLICMTYDFILEPFATLTKHYWEWAGQSVPPLNYAAWFVLSALLIRLFAPTLSNRYRFDPCPAMILILTVLIFIAGQLKQ